MLGADKSVYPRSVTSFASDTVRLYAVKGSLTSIPIHSPARSRQHDLQPQTEEPEYDDNTHDRSILEPWHLVHSTDGAALILVSFPRTTDGAVLNYGIFSILPPRAFVYLKYNDLIRN